VETTKSNKYNIAMHTKNDITIIVLYFIRAVYTYCKNVSNENGNVKFHCHQYSPKIFDLQIAAMKLQTEVRNI